MINSIFKCSKHHLLKSISSYNVITKTQRRSEHICRNNQSPTTTTTLMHPIFISRDNRSGVLNIVDDRSSFPHFTGDSSLTDPITSCNIFPFQLPSVYFNFCTFEEFRHPLLFYYFVVCNLKRIRPPQALTFTFFHLCD